MSTDTKTPRLKTSYETVRAELMAKRGIGNIHAAPTIKKVVVSSPDSALSIAMQKRQGIRTHVFPLGKHVMMDLHLGISILNPIVSSSLMEVFVLCMKVH